MCLSWESGRGMARGMCRPCVQRQLPRASACRPGRGRGRVGRAEKDRLGQQAACDNAHDGNNTIRAQVSQAFYLLCIGADIPLLSLRGFQTLHLVPGLAGGGHRMDVQLCRGAPSW